MTVSASAVTSRPYIPAMASLSAPITPFIPITPKTRWHCSAYDVLTERGTAASCIRPGCSSVRSNPEHGCVCFEREPGADDEPGPPARVSLSGVWTVRDSTVQRLPAIVVPVQWAT